MFQKAYNEDIWTARLSGLSQYW